MKPHKIELINRVDELIQDLKKNNYQDESKFRQRLGGLKGKYPRIYKDTLLLE